MPVRLARAPAALAAVAALSVAAAAGCGNEGDPATFPDPATPAASPPLTHRPAGRVVAVGGTPVAVAFDARTRTVRVRTERPRRDVVFDAATLRVVRRVPVTRPGAPRSADTLVTARLDDGRRVTLARRARRLTVEGPSGTTSAFAGIGPTEVAVGADDRIYVTDTAGGAVLFFRPPPDLHLARRTALPGAPYGAAIDREKGKLWVTLTATNEAVKVTADGAPRPQRFFPTVRQPDAIAVDPQTGRVYVIGAADGQLQMFDGYPPG